MGYYKYIIRLTKPQIKKLLKEKGYSIVSARVYYENREYAYKTEIEHNQINLLIASKNYEGLKRYDTHTILNNMIDEIINKNL